MFDSFSLLPAFGKKGIIILACLNWATNYILFLMALSPERVGASLRLWGCSLLLVNQKACVHPDFLESYLRDKFVETHLLLWCNIPLSAQLTLISLWWHCGMLFSHHLSNNFSLNAQMAVTAEHYLLNGISSSAPQTLTGLIDTCLGWPQTAIHCQTFSHMALYFLRS